MRAKRWRKKFIIKATADQWWFSSVCCIWNMKYSQFGNMARHTITAYKSHKRYAWSMKILQCFVNEVYTINYSLFLAIIWFAAVRCNIIIISIQFQYLYGVFSVRCSIETVITIHRMLHKATFDKFSHCFVHCFEINIRVLSFRFSFRPITPTTIAIPSSVIHAPSYTVSCLFRFMDELVGCSVCLVHIYLPTVYYYSWENCTTYISFSCIVPTTTKNWFSVNGVGILASDNQNIYWKWSSIRHKQVINNINRSQEEVWSMNAVFHLHWKSEQKYWEYSMENCLLCASQNAHKQWFSVAK